MSEIQIKEDGDIVKIRKILRQFVKDIGFGVADVVKVVTSASELARNVYRYAGEGSLYYRKIVENQRTGIELVFQDSGPGINDLDLAMSDGYSTSGSLGLGLPGAKRLMDEMEVETEVDFGTKITVRKWAH